ncbi:NADP-dependent oxidoreductase [Gordonia sp. MP11Mi]|uniref:Enoyl reductase (ER) domain-containing protein n=1 Tax=Gordonia sp. MP11Mi TaxID=3022769 RepID=A0AA97GX48_9ACTN
MKAARFHTYGGPDVLVVEDAPEPHAIPGSVRIAVQAVSVNPIDYIVRSGDIQDVIPLDLPAITGRDAVGIVDEVGDGVAGTHIGDRVFGLGGISDTAGEYAVLTAWSQAPARWSTEQAAAAGLASVTAAAAIEELGDLAGKTLLIDGASGAVGTAAAAMARAAGATVIGTGSERNQNYLAGLGITASTYGPGLSSRVLELAPKGIDAALHAAPSASLPELVQIVGDPTSVVTVIDTEGAADLGAKKVDARNESALVERGAKLGERGLYTPRADRALPLEAIAEAHNLAEKESGKIIVHVRSTDRSI